MSVIADAFLQEALRLALLPEASPEQVREAAIRLVARAREDLRREGRPSHQKNVALLFGEHPTHLSPARVVTASRLSLWYARWVLSSGSLGLRAPSPE
jgi:hypothetical protein